MTVYTDFLTYKSGIYHRTEDAFKFNGQLIVKLLGWESSEGGQSYWIVENTWGSDWGEDGHYKAMMQDKSMQLDFYALGLAVYPMTLSEYYVMQEQAMKQADEIGAKAEELKNMGDIDIDLDKKEEGDAENEAPTE